MQIAYAQMLVPTLQLSEPLAVTRKPLPRPANRFALSGKTVGLTRQRYAGEALRAANQPRRISMLVYPRKFATLLVVLLSVIGASATARPLICGYICDSFGKCYRVCS